jgi:hypothetical protein
MKEEAGLKPKPGGGIVAGDIGSIEIPNCCFKCYCAINSS